MIGLKTATTLLGITRSTLYRQLKKFQDEGPAGLLHGNKGKEPVNKLQQEKRERIEHLLMTRYRGFHPALARKYLKKEEAIEVSEEYIRQVLMRNGDEVKRHRQALHQSRRRRSRFGELIQIDGSPHHWFGIERPMCCLIAFIDDATGRITAAKFYPTETSAGYLELIKSHVLKYGIPISLYSDQHSIFTYGNDHQAKKGVQTQFQRCCTALGIESILARTPQAKGRIERLNRSLQGRWVKEFELLGINTIEKANEVLESFIQQYNEEFAVQPIDPEDAHVKLVDEQERQAVARYCAIWYERKLSKSLSCNFDNSIVQVQGVENKWQAVGKTVHLIEYPDGHLEVAMGNKLMPFIRRDRKSLKGFEQYVETSKTIDHRIDKIVEKERNRHAAWLEKRRKSAAMALKLKEEVLEAAESVVNEA